MMQLQRIVVPLSLSDADSGLLEYAAMVVGLGATHDVQFVHVVTPTHADASPVPTDELRERMATEVERHFCREADGVDWDCHIVTAARIDGIVEFAIERQADLILLGHRKARSGRRSLAQRLAMITPCSVWLVPEGSPASIGRILAPIDFSENSADSLAAATAVARLSGLEECEALHVFFDPSTIRYDERIDEIRGREQRTFDEFVADVNLHGVAVESTFMESSQPADAVLARARQTQTDLIVMSTRGRSTAASILLGSVTAQTMAQSPTPVLAVKHFGAHLNLFEALRASRFWSRPNLKTN